jgi:divalent metal cation (Fe/Co/Zn/Cd) transporter
MGSAGKRCTNTYALSRNKHDVHVDKGDRRAELTRSGFVLEGLTLGWNVIGIVVLGIAAIMARSVALAGFGLDSLIEIGASTVVIWELAGSNEHRQRVGLRLIGIAFLLLAGYLAIQSTVVLALRFHAHPSTLGIIWTGATAAVMFALAAGKAYVGGALENPVLQTEGKVTLVDGLLATAVVLGLALNTSLGWWWADPLAAYVLLIYAVKEGRSSLRSAR